MLSKNNTLFSIVHASVQFSVSSKPSPSSVSAMTVHVMFPWHPMMLIEVYEFIGIFFNFRDFSSIISLSISFHDSPPRSGTSVICKYDLLWAPCIFNISYHSFSCISHFYTACLYDIFNLFTFVPQIYFFSYGFLFSPFTSFLSSASAC